MKRCKQDVQRATRAGLAALTLLVALATGVGARGDYSCHGGVYTQPDGTILHYSQCEFGIITVDSFIVAQGSDGWWYYAELDARGEYEPSPYKVGIDDPYEIGIPRNLQPQRSAIRQAEIDAAYLVYENWSGEAHYLTQPDGTLFLAVWDFPLPTGTISWWCWRELTRYSVNSSFYLKSKVPGDGYVIGVDGKPLINYGYGDPFLAFVYDKESGWYYYALRWDPNREFDQDFFDRHGGAAVTRSGYVLTPQDEYVASPYKVGIDDPPIYDRPTDHIEPPPTAVQERSWGEVKTLFHK